MNIFIVTDIILDGHVDNRLLSKAQSLFHDLTIDRTHDVILHGDLHHDNILASGDSWKAIDPHGYMGDPAFEVGSIIFNPYDCFPNDVLLNTLIKRRLEIMIEQLSFDKQRIKAWAFCKTILSVAWTFEDHRKIDKDEFEIARIIDSIKV
jgi:streptomycin 6-kinase